MFNLNQESGYCKISWIGADFLEPKKVPESSETRLSLFTNNVWATSGTKYLDCI